MKNTIYYYMILLLCGIPALTSAKSTKKLPAGAPYRAIPVTCPVCPSFACTGSFTGGTGGTGATGVVCIGTGCTGCTGTIATICCVTTENNITVDGFATAGCQNVLGTLNVGLNVDVKRQLIVETDANFLSNLCVERNLAVGENALFEASAVVLGDLTVDTSTTIDDFLIVNNNQTLNGPLVVNGNQNISGALAANCNALVKGLLTTSGPLIVYNGQTISNGGLTVLSTGPTGPIGMTGPASVTINGDVVVVGTQTVNNSVFTLADLTVDQNAIFNNLTTNNGLITNSTVTINDGLTINGGDQTLIGGSVTLNSGTLTVDGTTNLEGRATANQGAVVQNLTVYGGQNIMSGNLTVAQNANVAGTLPVSGFITGAGAASINQLTLTDTTNSFGPTNGTLAVDGGVGVARNLWLGGDQYFADVSPAGNPAPLNYYEETTFSTGFTFGGQTVNPSTSVPIKIVRVGNIVNLLIPIIVYPNPGVHIDVISSINPLPARFRPVNTVRGASSTILYFIPGTTPTVTGALGEYNIDPSGTITFGLTGDALAPQRIQSQDLVEVDANTITYNIFSCFDNCNPPTTP